MLEIEGQTWLRLGSLVGVVQTPCGTTLEILPKTYSDADDAPNSRILLRKMVASLLDLPNKEADSAALERFDAPLTEWVMAQFVHHLLQLIRQGLRSDYVRTEEELSFLRGQLNTAAQMRQPLGKAHLFHIRHDVFSPDQAANRLLRLALERILATTAHAETWRLTNELSHRIEEIPASSQPEQDWRAWSSDRLMARYQTIKPWCALVLGESMPLALKGGSMGMSLLFPMEKLFESYVTRALLKQIANGFTLHREPRQHSLTRHGTESMFLLKPDLVVREANGRAVTVLDCKWKLVDQTQRDEKYGIQPSDMYQMLAYGCTYLQQISDLQGSADMYLVYPRSKQFEAALPAFELPKSLRLHAVPFDLELNELGIPSKPHFLKDKQCH